jgi:hypothetical protein
MCTVCANRVPNGAETVNRCQLTAYALPEAVHEMPFWQASRQARVHETADERRSTLMKSILVDDAPDFELGFGEIHQPAQAEVRGSQVIQALSEMNIVSQAP